MPCAILIKKKKDFPLHHKKILWHKDLFFLLSLEQNFLIGSSKLKYPFLSNTQFPKELLKNIILYTHKNAVVYKKRKLLRVSRSSMSVTNEFSHRYIQL